MLINNCREFALRICTGGQARHLKSVCMFCRQHLNTILSFGQTRKR